MQAANPTSVLMVQTLAEVFWKYLHQHQRLSNMCCSKSVSGWCALLTPYVVSGCMVATPTPSAKL